MDFLKDITPAKVFFYVCAIIAVLYFSNAFNLRTKKK